LGQLVSFVIPQWRRRDKTVAEYADFALEPWRRQRAGMNASSDVQLHIKVRG